MRDHLADKFIRGRGIEIGALHCPVPVPKGCIVTYVDRLPLGEGHTDVPIVYVPTVIDEAETLATFKPESQDFIIANHVLEHCHNPIGTLKRWHEVLRDGGIVYAAIPEKTQTFDRDRAVTPLSHLIDDYNTEASGLQLNEEPHYREYIAAVDKLSGEALEERVRGAVETRANIHFHVWDLAAQNELMQYMGNLFKIEERGDNGAEIIWVLRKKSA